MLPVFSLKNVAKPYTVSEEGEGGRLKSELKKNGMESTVKEEINTEL